MLVLVRMLPPEVYGQFGFVTALVGFLTLYSFRELLGHTLVVREADEIHYQDHFTAGAVIQIGVFALANVVALILRSFPAYADVAPVLHVMSVLFLLDLPSELRVKMLERLLDWRRLRLLHAVGLVVSGVLSIVLAVRGWGVYALLLPTLCVPVIFAGDLWFGARWRPTWQFSWARFAPAWRFGVSRISSVSFVSGAGLLEASWLSALSFATFGVFGRATGLSQLLCGRIAGLLSQSVFPVLARIPPRSDSYRRAGALYLRSVAWFVVPLGVTAALLADPIVRVLYGHQWLAVIPLLPWAVAGVGLAAIVQTGYVLLLAHQQQNRCLIADIWRLAGTAAALSALAGIGMEAYLAGMALVHAVSLAMVCYWLYDGQAVSRRGLVEAVAPPVVSALLAGGVAEAVRRVALPGDLTFAAAAIEATVLGVTYVTVLRLVFKQALGELIEQLPEQRRLSRLLWLQRAH